jgi:multiple sugar transport system ATP-binding protein
MNFFEVEVGRADGRLSCALEGQTLALPFETVSAETLGGLGGRRKALMGVRPMDLTVGVESDLAIEGEVFLVEPIGPISYVDADVGGRAVKGVIDPDRAPAVGERVTFGCPAGRVHLFDPVSEARL